MPASSAAIGSADAAPSWYAAVPLGPMSAWEGALYLGLSSFLVHELIWAVCNVPYIVVERNPDAWKRYKLQPNRPNSYAQIKSLAWRMVLEHVCIVLPASLLAGALTRHMVSVDFAALPSASELLWQVLVGEVFHDVVFYVLHRWLHTPWMYAHVHKVHHEYTAPFALAGEHAHWFEAVFVFIGPIVAGFVFVALTVCGPNAVLGERLGMGVGSGKPMHLAVVWALLFIENWQSVEGHSGYLMPWHKDRFALVSWWNGGAPHHDAHHIGFNYNFGTRWIDLLFGTTERHYREQKRREKLALPPDQSGFGAYALAALVVTATALAAFAIRT